MRKIWAVIRRELVERVRTRAFIISTFFLPLLMVGMMFMPVLFMKGGDRTERIALVDGSTAGFGATVAEALKAAKFMKDGAPQPKYDVTVVPAEGRVQSIRDSMIALTGFTKGKRPDAFDGVLVLDSTTLESGTATYLGGNVGSLGATSALDEAVTRSLIQTRLNRAGVDPAVVARASVPARIDARKVSEGRETGESGSAAFGLAYGMGFLLYFVILIYGQQTAISVIEEKSSRIMEVIASSLTPFQMLLGKIMGVGLTGLLQLSIWGGFAFAITSQKARIAGVFGADPAAVMALPIPKIPVDLLLIFLAYFGLGFLIFGALFAAIGSMVNSMQEMQQFMMPVTLSIVFGFFGMFAALRDPTGGLGLTFSFIPFFAPFVVPVRWAITPLPIGQLIASLALMVLGVLAVAWLAGRIYRTGILMYGKKPTFGEIFRWIKAG